MQSSTPRDIISSALRKGLKDGSYDVKKGIVVIASSPTDNIQRNLPDGCRHFFREDQDGNRVYFIAGNLQSQHIEDIACQQEVLEIVDSPTYLLRNKLDLTKVFNYQPSQKFAAEFANAAYRNGILATVSNVFYRETGHSFWEDEVSQRLRDLARKSFDPVINKVFRRAPVGVKIPLEYCDKNDLASGLRRQFPNLAQDSTASRVLAHRFAIQMAAEIWAHASEAGVFTTYSGRETFQLIPVNDGYQALRQKIPK